MPRLLSAFRTSGLRTSRRLGLGLALLAFIGGASPARAQEAAPDVHGLFVSNCAQCHGETGDGQGTTKLDRPARSFKDGGFSYGNTPEALFRTISMGIPGTPMPAFDSALDEAKRRALADYVITLGPEIREVKEEDMVLVVRDRPLVVRGKLPPIAEGAVEHPRGLLIGTTDGFTFEYQADDVRLLGVRQGDFVRRSDWVGRGGTGLEPLGKVVYLVEGGTPASTFSDVATGSPLRAHLTSTRVTGGEPRIDYQLIDAAGCMRAGVEETVRVVVTRIGAMFQRGIEMRCGSSPLELMLALPVPDGVDYLEQEWDSRHFRAVWRSGESVLAAALVHPGDGPVVSVEFTGGRMVRRIALAPGQGAWVKLDFIPLSEYSDQVAVQLRDLFGP